MDIDFDIIDRAFAPIRDRALQALEPHTHRQKKLLFHYTSATVLQKLVERPVIWATDTGYLNDASEMLYALDVVALIAKELRGDARTKWSREFLSRIEAPSWPGPNVYEVYVSCFSEEPDVLSQWRAYANDGAGYSIGIEVEPSFSVAESTDAVRLVQVIYGLDRQKDLLRPWVSEVVHVLDDLAARQVADDDEESMGAAVFNAGVALKMVVSELAVVMKNPGFSEEHEWRLVFSTMGPGGHAPTKFRSSRFGLTPYVEITTHAVLPLRSVTRGPKLDSQEAHVALFRFLTGAGFKMLGDDPVKIQKSQIAYR